MGVHQIPPLAQNTAESSGQPWPDALSCHVLQAGPNSRHRAQQSSKIQAPRSPAALGFNPQESSFGYCCFSNRETVQTFQGMPTTSRVLGMFTLHKTLKLVLFSIFSRQGTGSMKVKARLQKLGSKSFLVLSTTLIGPAP